MISFADVASDAWYYESVRYIAEHGLMNGYGSGQFDLSDNVTREQLAVILWRLPESRKHPEVLAGLRTRIRPATML